MKYILNEHQLLNVLSEQSLLNPDNAKVIIKNKEYFGLPMNPQITPEYSKIINSELKKRNISDSKRTLMGSLINFLPYYETGLDIDSIIEGIVQNDESKIRMGILGLSSPFVGKALFNLFDYFSDKVLGTEQTDYNVDKRTELVNMSDEEKIELFKRYGYGGYDKWVKEGKPKLK